LKLIRQHGYIEEVVQNLSQTRYSVPEDWPYQEVRALFKEPNVCTDIPDFLWTPPDEEVMLGSCPYHTAPVVYHADSSCFLCPGPYKLFGSRK
jgi:hypothetical protein